MRALKDVDVVDMSEEKIREVLDRVKTSMDPDDYEVIRTCVESSKNLYGLIEMVREKEISIKRLLGMLFGARTEKTDTVLGDEEKKGKKKPKGSKGKDPSSNDREKPKGHGRNGADNYPGAKRIPVSHPRMKKGCTCPECRKGKVYRQKDPGKVLRILGSTPVTANIYEPEKWRCNLCGEVFTAQLPPEAGTKLYDETAGSAVSLLKYGTGMPFNRLQNFQKACGIPLPAATQWEIVEGVAGHVVPAYGALLDFAAQGQLFHNDDTNMTILDLLKEKEDPEKKGRTGVFTTGIISVNNGREIALFFTGRQHAGENLADVLRRRQAALGVPLQMCDGLSRNEPKEFETIISNCMAHGRRKFVDIVPNFPGMCRHVLENLREVYRNDAITGKQGMTDEERLAFHQTHSKAIMDDLHEWMEEQLKEKHVEPNSSMGKAITYMKSRWEELTRFLTIPGAPLDNNLCERALKLAIQHRKNSYFFKTQNGARVGDMMMSIIHTCRLCDANPFDYLTQVQRHTKAVKENPEAWLPWNYTEAIELFDSG